MQYYSDYHNLGFSMALTNDTVLLFLLLMPGFLSSIILNKLIVRKPPSGLTLVIEALVFSFVIYACVGVITGQFLVTVGPSGIIGLGQIGRRSLAGVLGLSIALPVGLGFLHTHDYLFRFLGWVGVTRRTDRASTWLDVFIEHRRFVVVQFTDGRRLYGWPELYSDDVNEGMLFLSQAAWLDDDGRYRPLGLRGFFIVDRTGIQSIMFTNIGYNGVECETYGEQSFSQSHNIHGGSEPSYHQGLEPTAGDERKEPAPKFANLTAPGTSTPTTEEELVGRAYAKE